MNKLLGITWCLMAFFITVFKMAHVVSLFLYVLYFTCALCVLFLRKFLYNVFFFLQEFLKPFVNQGLPSLILLVTFTFFYGQCLSYISVNISRNISQELSTSVSFIIFSQSINDRSFFTDSMLSLSNFLTSLRFY